MFKTRFTRPVMGCVLGFVVGSLLFFHCLGNVPCLGAVLGDDYGTFATFYTKNIGMWGWVGIAAAAVIGVVITIWTLGAGAPAWCAAVGAWIGGTMGLSGAAATSAGLALLGGGSLAAGGWGVAGGTAVLVATLTFGTEMIVGYGMEQAFTAYSNHHFAEDCKKMLHLPLPVNTKGGHAYYTTQQYLASNFQADKLCYEGENPAIIKKAIADLKSLAGKETAPEKLLKDQMLLSLLYWLSDDSREAHYHAKTAIQLADKWNEGRWSTNFKATPTLAYYLFAVTGLEIERGDKDTIGTFQQCFDDSVLLEPKNPLIPLMFGAYMDRLMELYHYDKIDSLQIEWVIETANNVAVAHHAPQLLVILTSRLAVQIKRCQQDILVITNSKDDALLKKENVKDILRNRLEAYKALITITENKLLPGLQKYDNKIPKTKNEQGKEEASPYCHASMKRLLLEYKQGANALERAINGM